MPLRVWIWPGIGLRWAEGDKNMPGASACSFIGIVRSVWGTAKKWNLCIWESPERYNVCCFLYMLYLPVPAKYLHLSSNLALRALQDVLYPFDKRDRSIEKLHNLLKMMVVVVVTSQEATQGRKSWFWFMGKVGGIVQHGGGGLELGARYSWFRLRESGSREVQSRFSAGLLPIVKASTS